MIKKILKSVRAKLFLTLCVVVLMIILFFVIINNAVLETYYYYSTKERFLEIYNQICTNISKLSDETEKNSFSLELEKISTNNNIEIVILNGEEELFCTNKDYVSSFGDLTSINYDIDYSIFNKSDYMYSKNGVTIRKILNKRDGISYILLNSKMEDNKYIYIRTPVTPIQNSVNISNRVIVIMGFVVVILCGFIIMIIAEKFTKPIEELNEIANEMSNLNFKRKYRINDSEDEINELGKSINTLSDKLEDTIKKLQVNNSELEKDIEEKSKIDDMRKQFISDVSHELKTPIALIQGYAEGLVENVSSDEESRKFYAEVILDESNKMDKLVKRLLELMKLEYEDRKFNDSNFDIVELINSVIKNSQVVLQEQNIEIDFKEDKPIYVYADDFYIEQVVTNYFTNAIKNVEKVNNKKQIKISIKKGKEDKKYRISVYNTGKNISQENLNRIWTRFYKIDESRDRSKGGTGIGLALVKAIMTKYNSKYGVVNKKDGVEFYFEIKEGN